MSLFKSRRAFPPPVPPVARPRTTQPHTPGLQPALRLAVVDTETTGLRNGDSIVEIAAVVMDDDWEVVDEFDTLVNPQRDVGPTHIHGVTASMVSAAPTFKEVAWALADRIDGAVLVAHNLSFDARFLVNEYGRVGATFAPGTGICTLRLTGERLEVACGRYGVELDHHHRALADARAAARLLQKLVTGTPRGVPAGVHDLTTPHSTRTLRRGLARHERYGVLPRLVRSVSYPTTDGGVLSYLDMLDYVLDDGVISEVESVTLHDLARDLGLSPQQVSDAHRSYFDEILTAAMRDRRITTEEHALLELVAAALDLDPNLVPATSPPRTVAGYTLTSGMGVCFTGAATDKQGRQITRSDLEAMATRAGLEPLQNITKKCRLLVAADPSSMSGKARKAHEYGIPIMSVDEFREALSPGQSEASVTSTDEPPLGSSDFRVDPKGLFKDLRVCLTGEFRRMKKDQARHLLEVAGAQVDEKVTDETQILIRGEGLSPQQTTAEDAAAAAFVEAGHAIRIMSEEEFSFAICGLEKNV